MHFLLVFVTEKIICKAYRHCLERRATTPRRHHRSRLRLWD